LVVEFAFALLVIFMQSTKGYDCVPNDRLLLAGSEKERLPEAYFGSTRKDRDRTHLEAMEDAALLSVAWK
jgi:hypothetical protein